MKMKKVVALQCVLLQFCVFYMGALGRVPKKCKKYQFQARDELQKCRCGLANEGRNKDPILPGHMIIGGCKVLPGNKYPWMARLYDQDGEFLCGAAMISPNFLLTAAHCFVPPPKSIMTKFITSKIDHHIRIPAKRILSHPKYSAKSYDHDIAIVQLQRPLKCTPDTRPICLNHMRQLTAIGTGAIAAGWGQYIIGPKEQNLPPSSYLKETDMTITNFKACNCSEVNNFVCATGSGSICFGNSGGPLFRRYRGKYYALGVSSYSHQADCDPKGRGDMFTRVDYYYNWIRKQVNSRRS